MKHSISDMKANIRGLLLCIIIAIFSWILGERFPIVGGPVFAILAGMIIEMFHWNRGPYKQGITFASKKVLHWAVILLGFGLNLNVVIETGRQSLPIILSTITVSLIVAYVLHYVMKTDTHITTLIGVGSSICGGSAIAATAPVIKSNHHDVAQAISIIFIFNVIAALVFPTLGQLIGFDTTSGEAFGIFAGTAVNDTSSVTACASTWDSLFNLGSQTLDKAITVKLTRTLAIIPITLFLAYHTAKKEHHHLDKKPSLKSMFPMFILYFIFASLITTIVIHLGGSITWFAPFKLLSKFFIVIAMAGIGLNTDIRRLIRTGGKPIIIGFSCWISISIVSLIMQHIMHIW